MAGGTFPETSFIHKNPGRGSHKNRKFIPANQFFCIPAKNQGKDCVLQTVRISDRKKEDYAGTTTYSSFHRKSERKTYESAIKFDQKKTH